MHEGQSILAQGGIGTAIEQPSARTLMPRIEEAHKTVDRLIELASNLAGHDPEKEQSNAAPSIVPNGMIAEIHDNMRRLNQRLCLLHRKLEQAHG